MVDPMSPRLTSSTTSAPASRANRTVRSRTAMPAAPKRSKNADCGFTTAASSPIADTQVSAKRSSPDASSGNPQSRSRAACGSIPTHSEPREESASSRRPPNVTGSTCRVVGPRPYSYRHRRPGRALPLGQLAVPDRVSQGGELAFGEGALQFGQHPHRGGWIAEHRRPDGHRGCPRQNELQRIQPTADATHAHNRQVRESPVDLPDTPQSDRAGGRAG